MNTILNIFIEIQVDPSTPTTTTAPKPAPPPRESSHTTGDKLLHETQMTSPNNASYTLVDISLCINTSHEIDMFYDMALLMTDVIELIMQLFWCVVSSAVLVCGLWVVK